METRGKSEKMAKNGQILDYLGVNRRANRRKCCIFLTIPKRDEPPVSQRPATVQAQRGFQLSAATLFDSREIRRAAVFL